MTDAVARNAIRLGSTASSVTDYYKGYTVEFTRLYKITGKKTVQKALIVAYDGPTKVATVSTLWLENVIPGPETSTTVDTYRIIPTYGDNRVSINPAIQTLDYITSNRYGRNLNPYKDLYLPSWLESARLCDAKSDVTVETSSSTGITIGDRYRFPATGNILWQGDVVSISGNFVTFTNVLGKLTNEWNSWKTFPQFAMIYDSSRLYQATAQGSFPTEPAHTSGTTGNLQYISSFSIYKVTGAGPASVALPTDGNPVRMLKDGNYISGYSLYDADGVNYWRYLGWDEHAQRYATQHQTNLVIDTSQPLFDNINSLIEHFGGMLRYNAGKYYLEIEDAEEGIQPTDDPRLITTDDILTKIKISDGGIKNAYNSLTVAYSDPANKFQARNISFFNSDYLRADKNLPKKGNLSIPGITNYYNARLLSQRYLTKSRFGLTVSFNMAPKGVLLMAGRVIEIPYARYGWNNKKFRITDMTHNVDTTVDIVATEYDDSFYQIKAVMQRPAVGMAAPQQKTTIGSPVNLVATNTSSNNERTSSINLTWQHPTPLSLQNVFTEVHSSDSSLYFVTLSNVAADGITITTTVNHGLRVGSSITPLTSANGIQTIQYFVVATPAANTLQLSTVPNGAPTHFTVGAINVMVSTATIIATVPYPEKTYTDNRVTSSDQSRSTRYYWVRYKIIES